MRSAFHLHYHAFWRHTSSAADPSNVVTVKKPICHRLFSFQTTPQANTSANQSSNQSPNNQSSNPPVVIPFHVYAGLNKRIAIRFTPHHTHPRFALTTGEQEGPDAEDESFRSDRFCNAARSLQSNALLVVQSAQSAADSLCNNEHEEKDNDHIVPARIRRRKSLVEKLQPIDSLYSIAETDSESVYSSSDDSSVISFDDHIHIITTQAGNQPINQPNNQHDYIEPIDIKPEFSDQVSNHFSFDSPATHHVTMQSKIDAAFADYPSSTNQLPDQSIQPEKVFGLALDDDVIYTGDMLNGQPHGQGQMSFYNGDVYYGTFQAGQLTGSGVMSWKGVGIYQGSMLDGRFHGRGTFTSVDGQSGYSGEWVCHSRHGQGESFVNEVCVYRGSWLHNERHGYGEAAFEDGNVYLGEWANGKPHGQGQVRTAEGHIITQGVWHEGQFVQSELSENQCTDQPGNQSTKQPIHPSSFQPEPRSEIEEIKHQILALNQRLSNLEARSEMQTAAAAC